MTNMQCPIEHHICLISTYFLLHLDECTDFYLIYITVWKSGHSHMLKWEDDSCKISVYRTLGEVRVECPLLSQPCHKDGDCVTHTPPSHFGSSVLDSKHLVMWFTEKSAETLTFLTTYTYKAAQRVTFFSFLFSWTLSFAWVSEG